MCKSGTQKSVFLLPVQTYLKNNIPACTLQSVRLALTESKAENSTQDSEDLHVCPGATADRNGSLLPRRESRMIPHLTFVQLTYRNKKALNYEISVPGEESTGIRYVKQTVFNPI